MEYLTQRQVPKTRFLVFSKSVTLTRWLWSRWQVLWLFTEMVLIVKVHMVARPEIWESLLHFPLQSKGRRYTKSSRPVSIARV